MRPETLLLSDADVVACLDPDAAFATQVDAFRAISRGDAESTPKSFVGGDGGPLTFSYAARLGATAPVVRRVASFSPANGALGLPELDSLLVVTDPTTGFVAALIEGHSFTLIRTAAAVAVAVERLALPGASTLALCGSGPQSVACARAVARVRALRHVRVWSRHAGRRAAAAASIADAIAIPARPADSPGGAVRGAELVIAATSSATPVFPAAAVADGALVVSLGSFQPARSEVEDALVDRAAACIVDSRTVANETAGPIISYLERHGASASRVAELGEVLLGRVPGRSNTADVLFFNSVGLGAQDAAAAPAVLETARVRGLGAPLGALHRDGID